MSMDKQKLWRKLISIEGRASQKAAAGITILNFHDGHAARALLNQKLGKKPYTKIKRYNDTTLKKAFEIVDSPEFLKELTEQFIKKGNDPETKLAVLRAQRLVDPSVEIPPELVEQAKNKQPPKIRKLWEELESIGVEACELVDEGDGYVGFKIRTPLHGYLSYARPQEIINVAKRDMRIYRTAKCKSCGIHIDYGYRDLYGNGECSKCGSIYGSIPENFGKFLSEKLMADYGHDGIIHALANWQKLYFQDPDTGYSWFLYDKLQSSKLELIAQKVKTKLPEITRTSIDVPVFKFEGDDDEQPFYADCRLCNYAIEVWDGSKIIIGLDCAYSIDDEKYVCSYPLKADEAINSLGFKLEYVPEKMRGYRENEPGIVWNILMRRVLELFVDVYEEDSLEAKAKDGFIGPICPNFSLIRNEELEDLKKVREEIIVFGLINYQRLQKEAQIKREQEEKERLFERLCNLRDSKALPQKRAECGKEFRGKLREWRQFFAENFSKSELNLLLHNPFYFKSFFNLSNKAYNKVISEALNQIKKAK